jgi:hypothetical protein
MEDLQTRGFDYSKTAKINIGHSHRLVLGLALVGKPPLHGLSGLAETSLDLQRRGGKEECGMANY